MKLRAISRVSVVGLVLIVGAVIFVHGRLASGKPTLVGADLGATAAPAFALTDQSGAQVSLAGQQGHPVVLVFLDTKCSGSCARVVETVRATMASLGPQADKVRWLAVSVDPDDDTAQSASAFVAQSQLSGKLRYLVGFASQLEPVWKAYGVTAPAAASVRQASAGWPGVFVIDGAGRERIYLDSAYGPSTLTSDLKALLA